MNTLLVDSRLIGSAGGGRWRARWNFFLVAGLLLPLAAFWTPLPAQSSATIYQDGRVLVRRSLEAEVPRGASTQRAALGALDLATLFSLDSSVEIIEATYDGATDQASVLRRAVGRRLLFRYGGKDDTLGAVVLGVDPERYRMPDGTIAFSMPGTPLFPPDLVVIDPAVNLSIRSTAARKDLRLGYFTGGARWVASYQVMLGASSARVSGFAIIRSDSLRLVEAELQLLAGSVSRAGEPPRKDGFIPLQARAAAREEAMVVEQKVGEFHLYSLPGRTTLLPGIENAVALFTPADVRYQRGYEVRGQIPYWGVLPQYGEENEVPVEISYTLQRPRKGEFGDRPLPGGVARLYQADSAGRQQLVGESALGHTPAGKDLRLGAGEAFDLRAKRVQTSYVTRRDSVSAGSWQTSATADYRVTLTNASDTAATVDVLEERGGEWSVLSSSVKPEKLSSTATRFRVTVPARGTAVLRYRVKVVW